MHTSEKFQSSDVKRCDQCIIYRAAVEAKGQFVSSGRSEGNENRRWHGTRRVCNLGDNGQTQFCSTPNCSLCSIIRSSFDISLWGKKTGWGRFGKGIYTSSTSSKSNDYSHNDCKSDLKAILLNKVVVGKGCKMLQDHTTLTAPPAGYDSVGSSMTCIWIRRWTLLSLGTSRKGGQLELWRIGGIQQRRH